MSKHTPGPWHVGGIQKCTVYDKFSQRIANSFEGVMTTQRSDGECIANARLIAAAPELLEALQGLAYRDFGSSGWDSHMDAIALRARTAIAKATGEQP